MKSKYRPGHRWGSLVLLARLGKARGNDWVLCQCKCGTVRTYTLSNLLAGRSVQCSDRSAHADPRPTDAPS